MALTPVVVYSPFTSAEIITLIALAAGGSPIYNEIVSGTGTTWTLADTPITGTVQLYANGQRLIPGVSNDYTISGATITTASSWATGTVLADYHH